jgi:signal transduction histidine kinase
MARRPALWDDRTRRRNHRHSDLTIHRMSAPEPTSRYSWRPVRSSTDRVIAGLAGGLAEQLRIDPVVIRLAFIVLAFAGGFGALLYGLLWLISTDAPPATAALPAAATRRTNEPRHVLAVALVVAGMLLILRELHVWLGDGLVWPVAVAALGSAVIWNRTDGPGRARLQMVTSTLPREAFEGVRTGRAPRVRIVAGSVLVVAGMAALLAANNVFAAARVARGVAVAVAVTIAGVALILGPWVFRLLRQVTEERRNRIRSEERAEMAAHLHDSVLQTLAMIQRSSSAQEMSSLARGQERELRAWLYGRSKAGPNGRSRADGAGRGELLSVVLDEQAARIERRCHVPVEVVVVGDAPFGERLRPIVEAAGEAITNASRHSGAVSVAVYCEVGPDAVNIYVRDEGHGFDTARVPKDRHGVTESIIGRMERGGGVATISSDPSEGTEVHLRLPVRTP